MFASAYRGKRVLVTGHTGFKGSWLCVWLKKLGAEVVGYSDRIPTVPALFEDANLASLVRHELGDIRDVARLKAVVSDVKPDYIFHLAAQAIVSTSYQDPLDTMSVNVMGTATVMEVLRGVDWPCVAVIITSDKVYDNVEWSWGYRETDRLGGKDIYSGSKGGAELAFKSYFHSFFGRPDGQVLMATARAGNVIGGGDWARDRIVADCIRAWSQGGTVEIRSPRATRPWQHVLEPLSGYLALGAALNADRSLDGESFNFGPRAEQNATVVELLSGLADVWGIEADKSFQITGDSPFYEASLLKLNVDHALLKLKWVPSLSYAECVDMTGSWYRDVVRDGADAFEVTQRHIQQYEDAAVKGGVLWAQ